MDETKLNFEISSQYYTLTASTTSFDYFKDYTNPPKYKESGLVNFDLISSVYIPTS